MIYLVMTCPEDYDMDPVPLVASVDKFQVEEWIERRKIKDQEASEVQKKIQDEMKEWDKLNLQPALLLQEILQPKMNLQHMSRKAVYII